MSSAAPLFESRPRRSALGLRCWDPLDDRIVIDGLRVRLHRADSDRPAHHAVCTANGYFGFHGVFGLGDYEREGTIPDPMPAYVLTVDDLQGRYLPTCRRLALPWQGGVDDPFISSETAAEFTPTFPGLMLFSAPGRRLGAGVETLRADLWDAVNARPAAFAQLLAVVAGTTYVGIADAAGRVVIPLADLEPNDSGSWTVSVAARYAVLGAPFPTGSDVPDQVAILAQADGQVRADVAAAPTASLTVTLRRGIPLVLRTPDSTPEGPHQQASHRFWIHPGG